VSKFRRRGRGDRPDADATDGVDEAQPQAEDAREREADDGVRRNGPWDESEVDDPSEKRISLGSMWIPGRPGLELRVEAAPDSTTVIAVVLVLGSSALQVQPFAAPRSEGIWADVRTEIRAGITKDGGTADEVDGPFGPELRTNVPAKRPDGGTASQRARFFGVDGPRWFLRGVLTGDAAVKDEAAAELLDVFRDVVVVRGPDAMAPREALPLRLPTQPADDGAAAAPDDDVLSPFKRGPEITEIR
jgi:hypothetical protein